MRLLTLFCAIAMVVAFALPAQAAVQNVKVSGDITIRSIYQRTYDLQDDDHNTTIAAAAPDSVDSEGRSIFMSTVGVNVEADLTDNVSAMIRLVSQRDWDADPTTYTADYTNVGVDLAYIALKEMLYSPLTLIIGRQDIWIGDGFIIGANQQDPNNNISTNELTDINSFDAIRGILDYDPWTIDLLYIKIDEGTAGGVEDDDDVDVYGVNVGYVFGQYNAEAEAYYFAKHQGYANTNLDTNLIHTIGARGSVMPLENLDLRGELAFQTGDYASTTATADREAWAADVRGSYMWVDHAWMPALGLEYVYLSGEDNYAAGGAGDWEEFDWIYRGKFFSAIRDFQEIYYQPDDATATSGLVNEHIFIVDGSIQPTDNILLEARYLYFLLDEDDAQGEDELGSEIDLQLTYDYTEDVSFGLIAAWFFPGDVFSSAAAYGDDTATEVIGSVSLVF